MRALEIYISLVVVTVVFVQLFRYYTSGFSLLSELRNRSFQSKTQSFNKTTVVRPTDGLKTPANIVQPSLFSGKNKTFECLSKQLADLRFPVCFYTTKEDGISGVTMKGNYYEGYEVSRFLRLLRLDEHLQFVDIGANIGLYALPAARVAKVIAVEPNWYAMERLATAVNLGAVADNITLVNNAVSDRRVPLAMGVEPTNQASAFVDTNITNATSKHNKCRISPEGNACRMLPPTTGILLDDLLPLMTSTRAVMKIDVQGHELKVFTEASAARFFQQINVQLVFMEWVLFKSQPAVEVRSLQQFFWRRNYTAFTVQNRPLQRWKQYHTWPFNILWKKFPYNNRAF